MRVEVLDGVFDRHDVLVSLLIDFVDHGSQRRRFPRAGGPGNEDQTPGPLGQLLHDGGKPQFLKGHELIGDDPERRGHSAALHEHVGAKAGKALDAEREIKLIVVFEFMFLGVGKDAVTEVLGIGSGKGVHGQGHQPAVHTNLRRGAGGYVEIGGTLFDHNL